MKLLAAIAIPFVLLHPSTLTTEWTDIYGNKQKVATPCEGMSPPRCVKAHTVMVEVMQNAYPSPTSRRRTG